MNPALQYQRRPIVWIWFPLFGQAQYFSCLLSFDRKESRFERQSKHCIYPNDPKLCVIAPKKKRNDKPSKSNTQFIFKPRNDMEKALASNLLRFFYYRWHTTRVLIFTEIKVFFLGQLGFWVYTKTIPKIHKGEQFIYMLSGTYFFLLQFIMKCCDLHTASRFLNLPYSRNMCFWPTSSDLKHFSFG